jgi:hypothetical protein
VWILVVLLGLGIAWQVQRVTWLHEPSAPAPIVEDRRQHHFRDLTYSETERLLQGWLRQAYAASTPRERGLALARAAALQRERGLDAAAQAAAREAMKVSGNDPGVRAILSRRLGPDDIRPTP